MLKKSFFQADVSKRELFQELAPIADDLWFWATMVLNDTRIKIPANPISLNSFIDVEMESKNAGETLASKNWDEQQYDVQLRKIIERYPTLLDKLIREAVTFKPYLSVVLPVQNSANINACLENFFRQRFPDFELILVNLGSRIAVPTLPTNFHVINYPRASIANALNLGLQRAAGDYVLFTDENSIHPWEGLEIVAKVADDSKADVIHFAGHIRLEDRTPALDDAPDLKRDTPIFLDTPRQLRAILWLQNKLSRRLCTKIFKRDFLLKHGITFGNDLAEFMFHALIQADKYLLVPQAFSFSK